METEKTTFFVYGPADGLETEIGPQKKILESADPEWEYLYVLQPVEDVGIKLRYVFAGARQK